MQTLANFIIDLDKQIEEKINVGKNKIYILDAYIEDNNTIDSITQYYNAKGIAISVRKCPMRGSYEICVWWD